VLEDSYRLFNCVRCREQVKICAFCDRGQIYCATGCSRESRREKQRAAGRRYQATYRGRRKHAARQARYRERRKAREKVTHQGPPDPGPRSKLLSSDADVDVELTDAEVVHCDFCGRPCRPFARLDPLRMRRRKRLRLARTHRNRAAAPVRRGRGVPREEEEP
jgi:hypothetical protein